MPSLRLRLLPIVVAVIFVATVAGVANPRAAGAQAPATATTASILVQAYITNTFEEAINVRLGPSTISYPICGTLPVGATAAALGTTPAHEWVQIDFAACPGGVGWVYAANVTLTGSLRELEPPATPVPLASVTLDPTLVAAFHAEPTSTRLPTFTAPPPLTRPTFSAATPAEGGIPVGVLILSTLVLGGVVLAISLMARS